MYITMYQINKPKIVWFLKFKFLSLIKLNFNGVNFIKKYYILIISKNCKFYSYIKLEIENGENLRWKFLVENF